MPGFGAFAQLLFSGRLSLYSSTGVALEELSGGHALHDLDGFARAADDALRLRVHLDADGTHYGAAATDRDDGPAVADLVQGQQCVGDLQRVHLVGADGQDAELDLLRGQRRGHQGDKGIRVLVVVGVPEGAEAVVLGRDGNLRHLRGGQIGLKNDVNLHEKVPDLSYLDCLVILTVRAE